MSGFATHSATKSVSGQGASWGFSRPYVAASYAFSRSCKPLRGCHLRSGMSSQVWYEVERHTVDRPSGCTLLAQERISVWSITSDPSPLSIRDGVWEQTTRGNQRLGCVASIRGDGDASPRHCGNPKREIRGHYPSRSNFPYALTALDPVLATQWDAPAFTSYRDAFPPEHRTSPTAFRAHVHDLVAKDVKISYLKDLQGYLWLTGYKSGVLSCSLFPDVLPAFKRWQAAGTPILIYSSGSVAAQKLLFQYTNGSEEGGEKDLRGLISGYFDTVNAGPKGERSSYEKIAATRGEAIERWLFLSDRAEEVEAAKEAGMTSAIVVREGNAALTESEEARHVLVKSFEEIGRNS
ncbi:hypothetical protein B2J93_773 [Marssonina coronariae]|uniref:Enolase-phosphatase E1 n=1 Tax=Diplocarpon coronariae TaxID=2795749 RepID=A0A218YYA8_9HELO|nr:hypothetical protein B2J93_773 [Marssonina coronariae]